jgi:hypothetical protein
MISLEIEGGRPLLRGGHGTEVELVHEAVLDRRAEQLSPGMRRVSIRPGLVRR